MKMPAAGVDIREKNPRNPRCENEKDQSTVDASLPLLLYAEVLGAGQMDVVHVVDAGGDGWLGGGEVPLGDGDLVALLGLLEQRAAQHRMVDARRCVLGLLAHTSGLALPLLLLLGSGRGGQRLVDGDAGREEVHDLGAGGLGGGGGRDGGGLAARVVGGGNVVVGSVGGRHGDRVVVFWVVCG